MTPYEAVREEFDFPFELYPFQIERLNTLCEFTRGAYYWQGGCVDSETEYLTPTGWNKISDYSSGVVAQYDPDNGGISFVEPDEYIKRPCNEMIRVKSKYGLDQLLSPEHRVLVYRPDRPGRREVVSAESLLQDHDLAISGQRRRRTSAHIPFGSAAIRAVFRAAGGSGLDLTEAQVKLQVAVIADGHFGSATNRCVMRLKKARKIERLRLLLEDAGVEFSETVPEYVGAEGFHIFRFRAPLRLKEFDSRFWSATTQQISVLAHEVVLWDGCELKVGRGVSFTSTSRASADFVQYIWTVTGTTSRITRDLRQDKYTSGECYTVTRRSLSRGGGNGHLYLKGKAGKTMWREPSTDGFKYCFSVPTKFLVLRRNGCVFTTGNTGKTPALAHWCLYQMLMSGVKHWVLPMPPILLHQWARFLGKIVHKRTGRPLTTTVYAGTAKQRAKLNLNVDFILCSYGILKNDYDKLASFLERKKFGVCPDEAHAIKNIDSLTHQAVRQLAEDQHFMALTGTPLTTPGDAYAYIRMIAPTVYRNHRQFEKLHVVEMDEYEKVTEWGNLELLASNMRIQTTRVVRREVMKELPAVIYTPVRYNLAPAHLALYRRIADEKLVEFEDGREINAISAQALRSALQQIIVNWGHFEEDDTREPAALDLVHEVFGELGGEEKLVVVANFRRSNSYLLEKLQNYNAVAVYGDVSASAKQAAIKRFIDDASCRCILVQPQSAGYGVDGLQHVCSDMLVLEAPTTAPAFHQVVWRLDREGQTSPVNCRIGIANETVQVRMFRDLLENDAMINSVQGGFKDLKDSIYGN